MQKDFTQDIQDIKLQIIKRQFSIFCKQNQKALALIFKALIKGEKQLKEYKKLESKEILETKQDLKESKNSQEKESLKELESAQKLESTIETKNEKSAPRYTATTITPLNLEG